MFTSIVKSSRQKGKVLFVERQSSENTGLVCRAGEVILSLGLAHVSPAENSLIAFFVFFF